MTCDKLQVHISGLATLQLGYTVFGPVPPLEPLASLALTTLGLGLQGVGLSMSYLGGQTLNMTQKDHSISNIVPGSLLLMKVSGCGVEATTDCIAQVCSSNYLYLALSSSI